LSQFEDKSKGIIRNLLSILDSEEMRYIESLAFSHRFQCDLEVSKKNQRFVEEARKFVNNKYILILSGGMDSTTLLYYLLRDKNEVKCLSFDYGQRHKKELEYARRICGELKVEHRMVDLGNVSDLLAGSSLTSPEIEVPEGHYAEESMKATVVPNRNMIMLSIAIGWAVSTKAHWVAYAAHSGDHSIYPDCRPEFKNAMATAAELCDWHQVSISTPFINMTKSDIVKVGASLGVPYEKTWSCYKGQERHCSKCGTCCERIEAFKLASVKDPTEYEDL
jgi:7-cyano-7-deazaguanine synthase